MGTHTRTRTKTSRGGGLPMVAAFDLLTCLLLVFTILAIVQRPATPPSMKIPGVVVVTVTWAAGSNDDVDTHVRDPEGNHAYFAAQDVGLMHLDYDDLGTDDSGTVGDTRVEENSERLVVRGAVPGEYIVNVHMFAKDDPGPQTVTVELWRPSGTSKPIASRTLVLTAEGQEETAFRFTLDATGGVSGINHLDRDFIGSP